jgi:hypothetical protein
MQKKIANSANSKICTETLYIPLKVAIGVWYLVDVLAYK